MNTGKRTKPMFKMRMYKHNANGFSGFSVARFIEHFPEDRTFDRDTYVADYLAYVDQYTANYNGRKHELLKNVSDEVRWLLEKAIDEYDCQNLDCFLVFAQTGKKLDFDVSKCIQMHCVAVDWKNRDLLIIPFREAGASLNVKDGSVEAQP